MRRAGGPVLGLFLALSAAWAGPAIATTSDATRSDGPASCSPFRLPVALGPGQPVRYDVAGKLCLPRKAPGAVQVLVPGATYGRLYWDFPVRPERHSYVQAMSAVGYATLALDRIGTGESSHPPPEEVTTGAGAFVVHQIVEALRAGGAGRPVFDDVVLVGHSLGSVIAVTEAARYGDVDGLILTGFLHRVDAGFSLVPGSQYPARLDNPRFQDLPPGYLTTRPGQRTVFYYDATTSSDVRNADEDTKETLTDGESASLGRDAFEAARVVTVPVLLVVGDRDALYCTFRRCSDPGGPAEQETSFWTTRCLAVEVMPDTGHSLNLHETAPEWFAKAAAWLAPGPSNQSCSPSGRRPG